MNKEWIFKWNKVKNRESDVSVLKSGKLKQSIENAIKDNTAAPISKRIWVQKETK